MSEPGVPRTVVSAASVLWGLASGAALVFGSLGEWATAGPFGVDGTAAGRDGTVTLALGAVALLTIAVDRLRPVAAFAAVFALSIGITDTLDVSGRTGALYQGSVGWGLVVVDLAAASLLAAALLGRRAS